MKEQSLIFRISNSAIKNSIYCLVFLMPIFFLPWTSDVLDFNKQTLLTVLVSIGLFAWMLKVLISGVLNININKVHIALGVFFLVYLCSTFFSATQYGSFWGWPYPTAASFLSLAGLVILYFLIVNNFSEKEISHSFFLLSLSVILTLIYGILQMFGIHIIPFDFAKNNYFNTIGSVGSLGIFALTLLPLFMVMPVIEKGWKKVVFILGFILSFLVILIVNYTFLWWMTLVASALIIILSFVKKNVFDGRWMFLPMFFLIISVFFIVFTPQIRWIPSYSEVFLSHNTNLQINMQSLRSSPVTGSGPGTFVYDFAKYKNDDFNKSSIWNVNFSSGSSKFLTFVTEIGILGIISWLLFIILPILYGIKYFILNNFADKGVTEESAKKGSLILVILSILIIQTLAYSLYSSNLSLDFVYFFGVASLLAIILNDSKSYKLKSSALLNLVITFTFTAVLIFWLGLLMLDVQRYVANFNYRKALVALSQNQKDDAIKYIKIAARNNSNLDFYFNQLSLYSLSRLQDKVLESGNGVSQEESQRMIQALLSDSVSAANISTSIGPKNPDNWSNKAYICQNLIGLISDAFDCSIQSYDKAIDLNPNNPYLFLQQGNVYLIQFSNLEKEKTAEKNEMLKKAQEKFDRAIELKENYAVVYLQKAITAKLQQDKSAESQAIQNASKYSEFDAGMALQIGLFHYQNDDLDNAKKEFQRSLSIIPNYANGLYYLGLTYDRQNKKQNAIEVFSKLLENNKDNKDIKKILDNLRSGKEALDGLVEKPTPPNPSEADPSNPSNPVDTKDVPADKLNP